MSVQFNPYRNNVTTPEVKFGVSRRGFLQGVTAALAGAGLLPASTSGQAPALRQPAPLPTAVSMPVERTGFLKADDIQVFFPKPASKDGAEAPSAWMEATHAQKVELNRKKTPKNQTVFRLDDLLKTIGIDPFKDQLPINGMTLAQFFNAFGLTPEFPITVDPAEISTDLSGPTRRTLRVLRELGVSGTDANVLNTPVSIDTPEKYRTLVANLFGAYLLKRIKDGRPLFDKNMDALPQTFREKQNSYVRFVSQVDTQDRNLASATYAAEGFPNTVDGSIELEMALFPGNGGNERLLEKQEQLVDWFELLWNEAFNKTKPDGGLNNGISPINGVTQDYKRIFLNAVAGTNLVPDYNHPPRKAVTTGSQVLRLTQPLNSIQRNIDVTRGLFQNLQEADVDNYFQAQLADNALKVQPFDSLVNSFSPAPERFQAAILNAASGAFNKQRTLGPDEAGNEEQFLLSSNNTVDEQRLKDVLTSVLSVDNTSKEARDRSAANFKNASLRLLQQTFVNSRPGVFFSENQPAPAVEVSRQGSWLA